MAIYFDNAATTAPSDEAVKAFTDALSVYGNPSSPHAAGTAARALLEDSRKRLSALVGCKGDELYFTASGTESNNIAIHGLWESRKRRGKRVIITDSEHPSVTVPCEKLEELGAELVRVPTLGGKLDIEYLTRTLDAPTAFVSVMAVNNETGAVYDLKAVRAAINKSGTGAPLHCDFVQGFMKAADCKQLLRCADTASFSAHKLHGVRGVGGLMIRSTLHLPALVWGGGQEKGIRSGTENTAGAAAFATAAEHYGKDALARIAAVRARIEEGLRTLGNVGFNLPEKHVDGILNISLFGIKSETALNCLSAQGIYISASSACSSGKAENSVLSAFGLDKAARECALRIGISPTNTVEEADALVAALKEARERYGRI